MVVILDIETTGLNPFKNKVVLIGIKKGKKIKQWKLWKYKDNEVKMIKDALNQILDINETIIGFNNLKFDVPFLIKRLDILEKKLHPEYWELQNKKWFDLYQFLGDNYRSLREWLKKAGIKQNYPELCGSEVPIFYERKEYKKIEDHNKDDLISCEKLFNYFKEEFPDILSFE